MKRRIGDRKDGYRLRKTDPFFRVIPYIMKHRNDAQVFFEERVYFEEPQQLIRQLRKEGYKIGFLHIVLASMVRVISQKPKVNRFISGKKCYARNEITISLAIKKDMSENGEETTIKVTFEPNDTIYDVTNKLNAAIDLNKKEETANNTDKIAKLFSIIPGFVLSFVMGIIKIGDHLGILPRFLLDLSPFHSSIFVTDLGSLGIKPVYHHLYNFGNTTIFIAFGIRSKEQVIDEDLSLSHKKAMDLKFVTDERVVDGYYFASAIKLANKIMGDPSVLLEKPAQVIIDDEI